MPSPVTFFSTGGDINQITRDMLARQQNENAADQIQHAWDLGLVNSLNQRRSQYEQNQNQRYGMDVNKELGMANIGLGDRQMAMQERTSRFPWDLGVTPAQAQQFELQKQQFELYKEHPELFGSPAVQETRMRLQNDLNNKKTLAAVAASRANQALTGLTQNDPSGWLSKMMDTHGGWFLPTGLTEKDAPKAADLILKGAGAQGIRNALGIGSLASGALDEGIAAWNKAISDSVAGVGDAAQLIQFDPVAKKWFSIYDTPPSRAGTGLGALNPAVTPPVTTIPDLTTNQPVVDVTAPRVNPAAVATSTPSNFFNPITPPVTNPVTNVTPRTITTRRAYIPGRGLVDVSSVSD